jgi:flagellar biosynthesis/type III secretory pathway protein FliH
MDGSAFVLTRHDRGSFSPGLDRPLSGPTGGFLQRDFNEQPAQTPLEPMFDGAALAAAHEEGFAAGCTAGLAEAAASQAQAQVDACALIAASLAEAQAEVARVADAAAAGLARVLVAALHAVMPDLVRRAGLAETGAMLAAVLPGLSREMQIRVEVPQDLADGIAATVAALIPEHRDRITITCAEGFAPGAVRIGWASGHALRQPERLWQDVMALLEPALANPDSKDNGNGE